MLASLPLPIIAKLEPLYHIKFENRKYFELQFFKVEGSYTRTGDEKIELDLRKMSVFSVLNSRSSPRGLNCLRHSRFRFG
jgi:hypothetical protein